MQLLELAGLDASAITQMFGEPDRRSSSSDAENWYYGGSTIFFSGGKVAAWTGAEHLSELRLNHQFVQGPARGGEEYEKGVVSDWRPEANVSSDEVIKEIVGDPTSAAPKDPGDDSVEVTAP